MARQPDPRVVRAAKFQERARLILLKRLTRLRRAWTGFDEAERIYRRAAKRLTQIEELVNEERAAGRGKKPDAVPPPPEGPTNEVP